MYLAVVMDRGAAAPVIIAAAEGGVDIEELAETRPEAIARTRVHPVKGLLGFQARALCKHLGLSGDQAKAGGKLIASLVKAFMTAYETFRAEHELADTGLDRSWARSLRQRDVGRPVKL
jgi:succinyl-CoA synthetase beta subunit